MATLRGRASVFACLALMAAGLLAAGTSAQAASEAKVMLVLDASGSMWGQVEGKTKIEIARQSVRDLLRNWDSSIQLGLSAYGHRAKGDCNDIQTIYPVGPARPDAVIKAVDGLSPKGKTPLTEAVRRAAQELKFSENKATVILVSDGKETCEADPCAVGRELESLGIDFTIHVIGFDIAKEEQAELQCLAKSTGGLYISADNASGLNTALKTAVTKVKQEATKAVAKPAPKPQPAAKPGHRFVAVLAEGGEPVGGGMRWDVFEAATNLEGKRKHVAGTYDAKARFTLEPGRYVVIAKYGNATAQQEIEVKSAGETAEHVFVLNAGLLATEAVFAEGSETATKMRWDVFEPEKGLDGKRKHVTGNYETEPLFRLPAGTFLVVAKRGSAEVSKEVEITAGKRTEDTFNLNAGLLAPTAILTEGGETLKKGMRWDVYAIDKGLDGKRKHFSGNYDAAPVFTLTAGRYALYAKNGNAEKTVEVEVGAGKRTEHTVDLDAGQVRLEGATKDGTKLAKGLRWDIYKGEKGLDGKRARITGNYEASPIFTLPAGTYHVVLKVGNVTHEAALEVKPGDAKLVEVVLE